MAFVEIILTFFIIAISFLLRYMLKNRGSLEKLGIPIIKPFFIFGSPPYMLHKHFLHEKALENHRKYGKTFGFYDGREATISTIDPDLIKSIMVKHFENFSEIIDWEIPDSSRTLDLSGGETWRALRKALSPTFTSGKLKSMMEPMDKMVDNLLVHLDKETKKNPVVELKSIFQAFALDVIAACAFGIETNSFEHSDNDILTWGKKVFTGFQLTSWVDSSLGFVLSHLTFANKYFDIFTDAGTKLFNVTKEIIEQRRAKNIKKEDFIARLSDLLYNQQTGLSGDSIIAQGIVFFVAGFETTSNTMSTLSYNLAKYPEIQAKIVEEIDELTANTDGNIDYETISKMVYLDAVINENLRLNGPVTDNFRICSSDCEVNGINFKKGTRVFMPVWAAHHNEEFFPEPEKFLPERFFKDNEENILPFTFRAFGGGNRLCIGLRFAMNEMKLGMARLLQKFHVEMAPESKLEFQTGSPFLLKFDEVKMKLVPRN